MKILVTGGNGLLGQHLIKTLLEQKYEVIAIGKGPARIPFPADLYSYFDVDITDGFRLNDLMRSESPEIVVHTAAMTQVDTCELNQDLCFKVNVEGTANLVMEAEAYSRFFIYISTDFVFDGDKGDYSEEDELNPVNWYGFTKMQAESIVQGAEMPWSIVRTCLVYGNALSGTRTNIVSWVRDNLMGGKNIRVVSDQSRTPTYIGDLVQGILLLIRQTATGIFHISGEEVLTPFDMAVKTADFFGLDKNMMEKVDQSTFSQPGRRPLRTGFNIEKAKTQLGYKPISFDAALKLMK
jgi:dTDP-4-dehydrorhamnose reductase